MIILEILYLFLQRQKNEAKWYNKANASNRKMTAELLLVTSPAA